MSLDVLLATTDAREAAWLARCLGDAMPIIVATSDAELYARAETAAVIVVGATSGAAEADRLLGELAAGGVRAPILRIADPRRLAPDPRVAFVLSTAVEAPAVKLLIVSLAWRRPAAAASGARPLDIDEARRRERAFAATRRLAAAPDLAAAEAALGAALAMLLDADRAACAFVDAASGEVWSAAGGAPDDRRADRGLAGWAARTGGAILVERAARDPRWHPTIDAPAVNGDEQVLVQPVMGTGREPHAVLIATRGERRPPFTADELGLAHALATEASPLLEQLARHAEAAAILEQTRGDELFRREAVEAQHRQPWGQLLHVTPRWVSWAWFGLAVGLVALVTFAVVGKTHTYAAGPAVVRMAARSEVASRTAGNVGELRTSAGATVRAGDVLVRLDDDAQAAEVARLEQAFAARLRERLLAPSDDSLGQAVTAQRLDLERARAQLEERTVRAPHDGIIGDLRIRPGQWIEAGIVVASIVDPGEGAELVAVVPGGDRPRLAAGQRVRLELAGYHHAYQDLAVESVATEALGPEEARRYLGPIADGVDLRGPVVLVRARLPATFDADGIAYRYVDGMTGQVEIELGTERIIHALLPGLRRL